MIKRRDIAVVMVTCDRSPGRNYVGETFDNLYRGGLLESDRKHSVSVFNYSSPFFSELSGLVDATTYSNDYGWEICANKNVAAALEHGSRSGALWVLFIEDDIDVCANFVDSVGAWLDTVETDSCRVYALGAAYPQIQEVQAAGGISWRYPISDFYGTQCFAIRAEDAATLAVYLRDHCYDREDDGTAYDLLMHDWAKEWWPHIDHFLASVPSFVQHIGENSQIRPRRNVHMFESWPGREWSFV